MPAPAHHDHHLPTLIFHELMAVALFATSAYHSSQSKATQASFGLTFIAAIVYQTVLHLPSWNGLTCWSAPSLLSTSQYLPRAHEILFMTVALYISFITVQTMSRTYPRCRTALVQGLMTAVTFLLVVLPSHLLSAAFLWRTWHSNLPTVLGVPINEIERLLLFTTCLQLSSLLPRRTTSMHQHVKRALLSVLACCLLQFNGYIVPRLRIVVLTMVYGVLPLVLLFINNNKYVPHSKQKSSSPRPLRPGMKKSSMFAGALLFYFVGLIVVSLAGDPATHRSFGYHQKWGGSCGDNGEVCRKQEGQAVWKLCNESFTTYDIDDVNHVKKTVGWYALCGRSRATNSRGLGVALVVAVVSAGWFVGVFLLVRVPVHEDDDGRKGD